MRIVKNLLFITLPVLLVTISAAEWALWKKWPVADPYERFTVNNQHPYIPSEMPRNVRYRFTSNERIRYMDSAVTYTSNNAGFRGENIIIPKPGDELRIFLVGGSTSQCLYLDDNKSIGGVLQEALRDTFPQRNIKVYTAAKSGDASPDHLAMISQRIIHLEPDLIILFCGFNDMRRSVQRYDYTHLAKVQHHPPTAVLYLVTRSQLGRRLYYLLKKRTPEEKREAIPLQTNYRALFQQQLEEPESDSVPHINAHPYAVNLAAIAGICEANGIPLLLVPNQSTWNSSDTAMQNQHWLLTCGGVRYRESQLQRGLGVFNDTLKSVGTRLQLPVFDLPTMMPGTGEYFYDDCHFNNNGSAEAAKMMARFIKPLVSTIKYK